MPDDAAARRTRAQVEKKRKPRKYPVCLNSQTVNGSKKNMKKLLKRGATRGSCPAITTTPAPCLPRTWTPQGAFGATGAGAGQLSAPYGIALFSDARTLLVADANNHRISVWTRPGVTSTLWTNATTFGASGDDPDQLKSPNSVTLAPNGRTAWVADTGHNRISVWTRPGATSTAWAHQYNLAGPNASNGPGELASPYGAAVSPDTTTLLVADGLNLRVSVWTRPDASGATWTNPVTFDGPIPGPLQFASPLAVALAKDTLTA
ncbi:MAG: NHL repeat-containing protein [Thermomicrobiales bacterium]